jgi:hypothetical protein
VQDDPVRTDRTLRVFHAAGGTLAMRIYQRGTMLSRETLGDVNRWLMDETCGESSHVQTHGAV